jgi:hypothetical protein
MKYWGILICLLFSLSVAAINVSIETMNNPYLRTQVTGNWELHGAYTVIVRLHNTGAASQQFNRVEANMDFDATKFDLVSRTDRITGWTATNFFVISNGHIQYQRAANDLEPGIVIPAGESVVAYEFVLRVKGPLSTTTFTLDPHFTHVLNTIQDVTGALAGLTVTLVPDITPPTTIALPTSNMHLNSQIQITLQEKLDHNTQCGDFKEIRFTTDGSLPTLGSSLYSSTFTLPANVLTRVRWFGLDQDGNQEAVQEAQYRVDTIAPVISNVLLLPGEPLIRKKGEVARISFTVTDETALQSVQVSVGGSSAVLVSQTGSNYEYAYTVLDTFDGVRTFTIRATDHAGNSATNTSKTFIVDNLAPTFSIVYIAPPTATIGTRVEFQFQASEQLDISRTSVNVGLHSPATLIGNSGLNYTYERVIDGTETSGWIMVYGTDIAGNTGYNLAQNGTMKFSGYDLLGTYGETIATFNVQY